MVYLRDFKSKQMQIIQTQSVPKNFHRLLVASLLIGMLYNPAIAMSAEGSELPALPTTAEMEAGIDCVITAYYSPLPNQEKYVTGDFESEKRLEGNGTNGASGRPVFTGMVAASKQYPFGT